MVGPHICNQTGKDLLDQVATSLIQYCKANGGSLNQQQMQDFFTREHESSQHFDMYFRSYEKCMKSCKSHNFIIFNKDLYGKAIIDYYFNPLIVECFENKISRSGKWTNIFLFGFLEFTRKHLHRDFDLAISRAYKVNSSRHGGNLTIKHIITDQEVVNAVNYLVKSVSRTVTNNDEMTRLFCNFIDVYICKYYHLSGPDILKVNEVEGNTFLVRLSNLRIPKTGKTPSML